MRELTLLETGYLAGLLLLSLVLPLLMSICGPRDAAARKPCMKTVWTGQAVGAVAGLAVLASGLVAPYATVFGVASCFACMVLLRRQFRATRPA